MQTLTNGVITICKLCYGSQTNECITNGKAALDLCIDKVENQDWLNVKSSLDCVTPREISGGPQMAFCLNVRCHGPSHLKQK